MGPIFKTAKQCCDVRIACGFAALVFFTYAYNYHGATWNQNSRFDMVFTTVEPSSAEQPLFAIDRFLPAPDLGLNTGDWSYYPGTCRQTEKGWLGEGGHYYSNKAPGPALLGIIAYGILHPLERSLGMHPDQPGVALANAYLIHLWATVLPLTLAALAAYQLLLNLTKQDRKRTFLGMLALFWGSLLWPYASQFWGHATAAAFVIIGLWGFMKPPGWLQALSGLAIGLAVLCEYSCAFFVIGMCVTRAVQRDWCSLGLLLAGGLIPFSLFAWYHWICFGNPLAVANLYNNPGFRDTGAVGGLFSTVDPEAIVGLTVSPDKGLFLLMPVLGIAIPALYLRARERLATALEWLCAGTIAAFFIMNISFNGWHGGMCIGPRYQIPVLPAYILLLVLLPQHRLATLALATGTAISVCNMLVVTLITPLGFDRSSTSLQVCYESVGQMLFQGKNMLHPYQGPIRLQAVETRLGDWECFNWGELASLEGRSSVLPLLFVFGASLYLLWRDSAREPQGENDKALETCDQGHPG